MVISLTNVQSSYTVNILEGELQRVHHFKYHCSGGEETGGMSTEITERVSAAWINWKRCRDVLCDRRTPAKLN